MASNEITWNSMAGLAIDQMLERNENGNLHPLTSIEITVLNDIRGMLNPEEEPADEEPTPPVKKQPKSQSKESPQKKDSFHGLNSEDLT